jgi:hypothetical protein
MSTQVDPAHNLVALLIGTGEFSFSEDATSAANAQARGYLDFGNIVASTPSQENSKEEHFGSYRGVRRVDKTINTENKLRYKIKVDEWNRKNLEILYGGSSTTGHLQSALSAVAGQVLGFTATPAVIGKWYDIKTSAGARLLNLTTVTIATKVEGTDFVLDLLLARVKFLTAQAADLTPTITCAAIVAGDAFNYAGITPMASPKKTGFGKLVIFDQESANKAVLIHEGFSCEVTLDSSSEVDGQKFSEITLDVLVTDTVGTVLLRDSNDNAGI